MMIRSSIKKITPLCFLCKTDKKLVVSNLKNLLCWKCIKKIYRNKKSKKGSEFIYKVSGKKQGYMIKYKYGGKRKYFTKQKLTMEEKLELAKEYIKNN